MTRFVDSVAVDIGGTLTVMTMPGTVAKGFEGMAGEMVKEARSSLFLTLDALKVKPLSGGIKALARKYFCTTVEPSTDDLQYITKVLRLTRNGLLGDQTVKFGSKLDPDDSSVVGSVAYQDVEKLPTKPYHTKTKFLSDNQKYLMGAMKIDATKSRESMVNTIIHEATHRYAGTIDYAYFDKKGENPEGTFGDKRQALMNADSYAWFASRTAKKKMPRGY